MFSFDSWHRSQTEKTVTICGKYSPTLGNVLIPSMIEDEIVYMTLANNIENNILFCKDSDTQSPFGNVGNLATDFEDADTFSIKFGKIAIVCHISNVPTELELLGDDRGHTFALPATFLLAKSAAHLSDQNQTFSQSMSHLQNYLSIANPTTSKGSLLYLLLENHQIGAPTIFLDFSAIRSPSEDKQIVKIELGKVLVADAGNKILLKSASSLDPQIVSKFENLNHMTNNNSFIKINKIMIESANGDRILVARNLVAMIDLADSNNYFSTWERDTITDLLRNNSEMEYHEIGWKYSEIWDSEIISTRKIFVNESMDANSADQLNHFDVTSVALTNKPKIIYWLETENGVLEVEQDSTNYFRMTPPHYSAEKPASSEETFNILSFATASRELHYEIKTLGELAPKTCILGNSLFRGKQLYIDHGSATMQIFQ